MTPLSTLFSTKLINVPANQHQSANFPARSPVLGPMRPSLENVAISSETPFTSSRRTGGDVCKNVCRRGLRLGFLALFLELEEVGVSGVRGSEGSAELSASTILSGASQLKRMRHFLEMKK